MFRNTTPRKLFSNEYLISPFKEFAIKPFADTPYKQTNYNIGSPDNNLRFNSTINSKYILKFIINN